MTIALYGAGAVGRDAKTLADKLYADSPKVFIDDIMTEDLMGCRVYNFFDFKKAFSPEDVLFIITMDEPRFRRESYEKMKRAGYKGGNLIDLGACISPDAVIGESLFIEPGVFVGSLAKVGNNIHISANSYIGHDSVIKDHVHIGANVFVGGYTVVSEGNFIGSGSMLRDRISIGQNSVVALGSSVLNDLPESVTAMGTPAKIVKENRTNYLFAPSRVQNTQKTEAGERDKKIRLEYWDVFSEVFKDVDFNPVAFRFMDEGWDTYDQLRLITELSEHFGITLEWEESIRINSYDSGLRMVMKKLKDGDTDESTQSEQGDDGFE